jgi:hypothetical protein
VGVGENKTLLIGANERRQIRRRQLSNLIESATQGIGITANLYSESSPSRIANPSELFTRLYFSARGEGLSQQTLHELEKETAAWLQGWSPVAAEIIPQASAGHAMPTTRAETRARERTNSPARRRIPRVSLRHRTGAVRGAGHRLAESFLGVEATKESSAWAIATGQWVRLAGGRRGGSRD